MAEISPSPHCDKCPGALRARIDSGSLGYGDAGGAKEGHRPGYTLLFVDRFGTPDRGVERRHPQGRYGDGLPQFRDCVLGERRDCG